MGREWGAKEGDGIIGRGQHGSQGRAKGEQGRIGVGAVQQGRGGKWGAKAGGWGARKRAFRIQGRACGKQVGVEEAKESRLGSKGEEWESKRGMLGAKEGD